jgi:hypothetical protein
MGAHRHVGSAAREAARGLWEGTTSPNTQLDLVFSYSVCFIVTCVHIARSSLLLTVISLVPLQLVLSNCVFFQVCNLNLARVFTFSMTASLILSS